MSINTTLIKGKYKSEISLPYGQLQPLIEWCQNNIDSNWHYKVMNEAGSNPGIYEFTFDAEVDYCKFLLWKK